MIVRTKYEDIKDKKFDAIVIGSGMGGLGCAGALAKVGKKILVLEQHYLVGGMTHTFSRKGFTWDVGVHALGEMEAKRYPGKILRWISDNKVKMNQFGDGPDKVYDTFNFPGGVSFGLPSDYKRFNAKLKEMFPAEANNIDRYFDLVYKITKKAKLYFILKTLPDWLANILSKVMLRSFNAVAFRSTKDVLDELFQDEKLKAIIAGQWGYYGSEPSKAAFFIQAVVTRHFWNGAFYPEDDAHTIAEGIVDVVRKAGGEFMCKAMVTKVLTQGKKAIGVELADGNKLYAPVIISAISAKKSWENFLSQFPKQVANVSKLGVTPCHVCLYIGIEGDIRDTEATESNQWIYSKWDHETMVWHPKNPDELASCLYISFPTLKDPLHKGNKHTAEVVTFVDWEAFSEWKDTTIRRRGEDYEQFKNSMKERLLSQMREHFPKLMEKMVYCEFSTPLSTVHYCQTPQGAIYGLEPTPERFKTKELKPKTPLQNFYLSGGDVATLGVVGALMGGVMTSIAVDKKVYKSLNKIEALSS